jgi:hypothetical protein
MHQMGSHEPFRSHMHHIGPYGSFVCHMASKVWGATWELTLYRSSGHHMGDRCSHMGGGWCHVGAACTMWEPHVPYGSHMGAMCSRWEADGARWEMHVLYGSRMNCMGPAYPMGERWHHLGAAWDVWGPYESCVHRMVAMCTSWLAPIWCHLPPLECHLSAIWLPSGVQGSNMVHMFHTAPYGPHMACITNMAPFPYVGIWLPCRSQKMHMAPMQCTWHPYGAHGTLMVLVALFASYGSHMGAIWQPCTPMLEV